MLKSLFLTSPISQKSIKSISVAQETKIDGLRGTLQTNKCLHKDRFNSIFLSL